MALQGRAVCRYSSTPGGCFFYKSATNPSSCGVRDTVVGEESLVCRLSKDLGVCLCVCVCVWVFIELHR